MIRPPLTKALFALMLAGGLAACDVTPVRTMWALRNVDPMSTAPEGLRWAVRIPHGFRPSPQGVALVGTFQASATQPEETVRFNIERQKDPNLPSWMRRAGAPLYGYKIADEDLERFRKFQGKARVAKVEKRGGSLSVSTEVCRLKEVIPTEILVSVFIKTVEIDEYVPLFEDQDITERASSKEIAEIAPLCQ